MQVEFTGLKTTMVNVSVIQMNHLNQYNYV